MSGGSYDYFCFKMEEFADSIRGQENNPRRAAFAQLCKLIAKAAHDIEWVDSCDYGKGDENKAIDEVMAFLKEDPDKIKKAAAYDSLQTILKDFFETDAR